MQNGILEAQGIRKQFFRKGRESARNFDAVAGIDLTLAPGSLTVLVGRSGGGKSTLLNILAGLLQPTEGTVQFDGKNIYAMDDGALSKFRNEHFGVIPQGQTPIHSLTVVENVMLPILMYRKDDGAERRALEALDRFGIKQLADSYPRELSGGELRRMAIARALVGSPAVVFADEPTGDLDDENTGIVLRTLRQVADDGAAVLLVTHEQEALQYGDVVLRMDSGRFVQAGESVRS